MTNAAAHGVSILGAGSAVPEKKLTNFDLEQMVETSDEWIVQRTGIHERRIVDPEHEGTYTLARDAMRRAVDDAGIDPRELDLVIVATVTAEMTCPSVACRIAADIGAVPAPAFDLTAACCGFVYAMNVADSLIRSGRYRTVGVVGCDAMSTVMDYTDRSVCILFGDAGGAAVLRRDDDPSRGVLHQVMHADATNWHTLYLPRRPQEIPPGDEENPIALGCLRMHGREVFKFAVSHMREVIEQTLDESGLNVGDVEHYICHQSNRRILEAAREKLGIRDDQLYINIDHYGNSSGGSAALCFDQLWQAGRIKPGDRMMLVAIGGGMTWATSLWNL